MGNLDGKTRYYFKGIITVIKKKRPLEKTKPTINHSNYCESPASKTLEQQIGLTRFLTNNNLL